MRQWVRISGEQTGCCENKTKEIQNCREVKCAKLRGSERSRFAIADDIFENKFFPVVKISKEKLFCCFLGFWPVLA